MATHSLVVPPPTTECGEAIPNACHQAGFTPSTPYVTTDIAAQLTLARAGLATAIVPRHTIAADPTTTAVIAALRTAAVPELGQEWR